MSRVCLQCGVSFPNRVFFCGHDGSVTIERQRPGDDDARLGTQLGSYVVVARIADGAMARVYEGRHRDTLARVAIKVLHAHVARDPVAIERFRREYETARSLDHPKIVDVIDFGETPDKSYFLTMEYLDGEELSELLAREGALYPAHAVRIACQLALGLHCAHTDGVIHRDLKPDNIYLCPTPQGPTVRILDFGSVKRQLEDGPKLTAVGMTLGSPFYMSPEQAQGKLDVDQRTDVFALAAILYEMATAEIAFEDDNVVAILHKIISHTPEPVSASNPEYPMAFDQVIERALNKDKTKRHNSCLALAEAMLEAFGLEPNVQRWAEAPVEEIAAATHECGSVRPPSRQLLISDTDSGEEDPLALDQAETPSLPPALVSLSARATAMPMPMAVGLVLAVALFVGAWLLTK